MTGRGIDDVILDMLESVPEYRSAKRRERR
jgi:hypothetical protein